MRRHGKHTLTELLQPLRANPKGRANAEANPALEEIWHAVCAIPRGKATTYGSLARAAGLPGRARQVGFALRMAPDELNLPWHRVVGAGARIVFPASSHSHREQARRLRAEGIRVVKGRVTPSAMTDLDGT